MKYTSSDALFSEDGMYRWWLIRRWNTGLPMLAVIGMNPSKADATEDDPTIRKVRGFAEKLECGGILMLNVGAFVSTDPAGWRDARDPFGTHNSITHLDLLILHYKPAFVVAAWGKIPSQRGQIRADSIKSHIRGLLCWGKNLDGSPRHPSRIPYSTPLEAFN